MKESRESLEKQRRLLFGLKEELTKKMNKYAQNFKGKEADQLYKAIGAIDTATAELYYGLLALGL